MYGLLVLKASRIVSVLAAAHFASPHHIRVVGGRSPRIPAAIAGALRQGAVGTAWVNARGGSPSICAVCRELFAAGDPVTWLPCCHAFHTACAEPWLAENDTCPTCRRAVVASAASPAASPTKGVCGPAYAHCPLHSHKGVCAGPHTHTVPYTATRGCVRTRMRTLSPTQSAATPLTVSVPPSAPASARPSADGGGALCPGDGAPHGGRCDPPRTVASAIPDGGDI
eukprot:gene7561-9045_t